MAAQIIISELQWLVQPAGNNLVRVEYWKCPTPTTHPVPLTAADDLVVYPNGQFETLVTIKDLLEDQCYTVRITSKCNPAYSFSTNIVTAKALCPTVLGIEFAASNQ